MTHYPESVKRHMSQQDLAELDSLQTRFEQNGYQSSCFSAEEKARLEQLQHDYHAAEATDCCGQTPN